MLTPWLNIVLKKKKTISKQLCYGGAPSPCLFICLPCIYFSHTGWNAFMVKEMSGVIYFKGNGTEWLKKKIILSLQETVEFKHTIPLYMMW